MRATHTAVFTGGDLIDAQVRVTAEAEAYLADVATRMRALGVKDVQSSVWYGDAAPAIIDAATFNRVDLIVMMSHGRSGLGRLVLGSVAESVLRGTTTPILLLRDSEAPVVAPAGAASCRK